MKTEVSFVAWGEHALFTRPESRADRVSYSAPTPSSCEGLTNAILFKPEMRWEVLQIAVLRPWWIKVDTYPRTMTLKRNEVKTAPAIRTVIKGLRNGSLRSIDPTADRTQRSNLILRDVAYLITVRPKVVKPNGGQNNSQKYVDMFQRRLDRGQFFHKPYFGCREFACNVRTPNGDEQIMTSVNLDCGVMLHHLDYSEYPPKPVWFHAIIRNGVLNCDFETVGAVA